MCVCVCVRRTAVFFREESGERENFFFFFFFFFQAEMMMKIFYFFFIFEMILHSRTPEHVGRSRHLSAHPGGAGQPD